MGTSPAADRILDNALTTELETFPPVVQQFLKKLAKTKEEKELSSID